MRRWRRLLQIAAPAAGAAASLAVLRFCYVSARVEPKGADTLPYIFVWPLVLMILGTLAALAAVGLVSGIVGLIRAVRGRPSGASSVAGKSLAVIGVVLAILVIALRSEFQGWISFLRELSAPLGLCAIAWMCLEAGIEKPGRNR